METKENNNTASTHQEKARKLKKLRRWQIVVSLLGIAILIWGIIQVVCLFLKHYIKIKTPKYKENSRKRDNKYQLQATI